jgi:hypothetical protein
LNVSCPPTVTLDEPLGGDVTVMSGRSCSPTLTELEQFTVTLSPPEVMVTDAVLIPVLEYVLVTDDPEPERLSVPLQE